MGSKAPDNIVQTSGPPAWALGYSNDMLKRANALSKTPYSSRVAGFAPDQNTAFDQMRTNTSQIQGMADKFGTIDNRWLQGYNDTAGTTLQDYARGNYLDVTKAPGYQNALDRIQQTYSTGIAPQTRAAFYAGGAGSPSSDSAYQETMGYNNRAFADALTKYTGDQYNTQQGLQLNAANTLPDYLNNRLQQQYYGPQQQMLAEQQAIHASNQLQGSGEIQQGLQQANLEDKYNYPREQLDFYGNMYNRAIGGAGVQTSPNPARGNRAAGALGGALSGAGIGAMLGGPAAPFTATAGALGGAVLGGLGGYFA